MTPNAISVAWAGLAGAPWLTNGAATKPADSSTAEARVEVMYPPAFDQIDQQRCGAAHIAAQARGLRHDEDVELRQGSQQPSQPRSVLELRTADGIVDEDEVRLNRPAALPREGRGVLDLARR